MGDGSGRATEQRRQRWRDRLSAGRASISADFGAPPDPTGWVVIAGPGAAAPRPGLQATVAALHRSGLATVVLELPPGTDAVCAAGWIHVAVNHLRDDLRQSLPIAYLGAGKAAAPGFIAAAGGALNGVMAWNGRPGAAWGQLPAVQVPSLLVVDQQAASLGLAARAAAWRLGCRPQIATGVPVDNLGVLTSWYRDRLMRPPVRLARPARRRVAPVAVAGLLAAAPAATLTASPAAASLPDFSAGGRLSAAQIGGDGKEVKPPHDDPPLTDGVGLRWNINTNVGFTTTSSASGAVSEAGFTHAVAASTLNGGTVNQVLADAFDGYNALCVDLNNVGGQCNTANMAVYNQNGPGSLECSGRQVVTPLRQMGSFQVRRKLFVPTNEGFARWLNIFRNTSASPQTVRMVTSNNLGSDANTRIVTTSDGDATAELTDTWVTTFQNFSGTTSSDPRLGHVLRGPNAPVGLAAINFANGDDNPFWRYQFTLAPGQTGVIMNFATGQATRSAAATESSTLASLSSANALACMTPTERQQVVNFVAAAPTITTQASAGGPVGTQVTDTATLADLNGPSGTITFKLFGPNDATCAGAPVFTDVVAVNGNATYPSNPFTTTAGGVYRWTADYSGDGVNAPISSPCNAANESVTITSNAPSLPTQASAGGPVGTLVTDTATLTGLVNPLGGTITFRLFGPDDANCAGAPVFTDSEVVNANGNHTSDPFATTAPGTYRWTAAYSGDANNAPVTSACNAPNESVVITKASPTISTQASPGGPVGTALSDTATVSGGFNPTGTVTFRLYSNATCTTQVSAATRALVNGTATSQSFAPAVAGTYYWTARYNGDANNNTAFSACGAANESAVIGKATPTLSTQASPSVAIGQAVSDTATLAGGNNPTGSIAFSLYGPNDANCTGPAVFAATVPVAGNGSYGSGTFSPTVAGTYRWVAAYSGDSANDAVSSACNAPNESVVVTRARPTITTQASAGGPLGTALTDTATVKGGFSPTGTVTFRLFSNSTCATQVFTSTNALAGGSATSGSFVPSAVGTYYWTAVYNGDANNNAATSPCNAPNESATLVKASPTISTEASPGGPVGTALTDTATLAAGFNPSGTVTFRLFRNNTCTTQVFTSTNNVSGGSATSGSFTPSAPGTYFWTAAYNGDARNNAATSGCNAPNESATIVKASPTLTTQASPGGQLGTFLTDTATLAGGFNPTGTVTFRLFSNNTCATQVFTSTNAVSGGSATSGPFTPSATGTYYWTAVYGGDTRNNPATSGCNAPNESATITAPVCTSTLTGTVLGPVVVNAGQSVCVVNASVSGPITVNPGGSLTVTASRITNGIVATSPAFLRICGSDISAPASNPAQGVVVQNATAPITIGDTSSGCAQNRVSGDVRLLGNTGGFILGNNIVTRNIVIENNSGTAVVKGNQASVSLACTGNAPAPTNAGQPNTAPSKTGQCAGI